jgi:hypothetical protein
MLENLNSLVREEAAQSIVNNPAIPNEKNEQAIEAASSSIQEVLKEKASSGNIAEVSNLFKTGDPSGNPIVDKIKQVFAGKLGNLGIDLSSASGLAAAIIPALVGKFVNRTNDPNDKGFDLQDILKQFAGPDGKFDMSDVTGMFNKKDDQQTGNTSNSGGGIGDVIGGFFK